MTAGTVLPLVPSGESDDWWTPDHLFQEWHREYRFTLDVAASSFNNKLPRYFDLAGKGTKKNGLAQPWRGERVWCNPPFSDVAPWVEKAHQEMLHGNCELVAMLLPANRTEQPWWQEYIETARDLREAAFDDVWVHTRFLKGRIRFGFPGDPTGRLGMCPRFGCVLVTWERGEE